MARNATKYDYNGMSALDRANRAKGGAPTCRLKITKGAKCNSLDKEADAWYAIKQLATGKTYQDIADDLNQHHGYTLTRWDIWKRINEVLIEWKRENLSNMDNYITLELQKLEEYERKAMEDYENSRVISPQGYAALMKRGMTIPEIDELYSAKPIPGDPRYLERVAHFQKQRMALLGLGQGADVPQTTIVNYQFNNVDLGELTDIADKLQDAKFKEIDEQ